MIPTAKILKLLPILLFLAVSLSAQSPDSSGPELRFGVIGDMGVGTDAQKRVAAQMLALQRVNPMEFVVTVGDNIYPDGDPALFGPNFKDIYQPLFDEGLRFHASIGNHDVESPLSQDGMAQVRDPAFGFIDQKDEYIIEAGPVLSNGKRLARFICLNSVVWMRELKSSGSTELTKRRAQLDSWLRRSEDYQWNFIYFHHPLYSYVKNTWMPGRGHGAAKPLRAELEDKLIGKIDVVFAGHDHFYQKIKPQRGVHHFVVGGGGRVRPGMRDKHPNLEYAEETLHFLAVTLTADRMEYEAINDDGKVIHKGAIFRMPSVRPGSNTELTRSR